MARRKRSGKTASGMKARQGLPPGSAVYVGEARSDPVHISVIEYNAEQLTEYEEPTTSDLSRFRSAPPVAWVNVDGVHDPQLVQQICDAFGVHPLAMEDVLNPATRAKADDYDGSLFLAVKMALGPTGDGAIDMEQVAIVFGPTWVLTFQERPGDVFDSVRRRIRSGTGRIRRSGADYLLHAILDAVVDAYFVTLEQLEGRVGDLEDKAMAHTAPRLPQAVHELKSELMTLRRAVWPLREAVGGLIRDEFELIGESTRPFYRDLQDHLVQCIETIDGCRDRVAGILELHLALSDHRMNESMRMLTVVATIFIPLTFLAGIYGMNFENMPELKWPWAYPALLGVMAMTGVGMVAWFRHRRWL